MDVLLFGDQAVEVYPYLHRLLFQREHTSLLTSFLNHVTSNLRLDISNLPRLQRQKIPPLTNLLEFVELYQSSQRVAPVDSALLCISQLAQWISMAEESPELFSTDRCSIGMCTGLLAASAVSTFSSPITFIPLAVETVRIAFRVGLQVDSMADQLRTQGSEKEVWSVIVAGITETEAKSIIENFHQTSTTSTANQAYISAMSASTTTISGPPNTLQKLLASPKHLKGARTLETRICGPYHAPHLYGKNTIDSIIGLDNSAILSASSPRSPIISASNGFCYTATKTTELFEQVIADILVNTLDLRLIFEECASRIADSGKDVRVFPIGPTTATASVLSALQAKTDVKISLYEQKIGQTQPGGLGTASLRNSKIAICGMSGRFPGGADVEGLWEVLTKGLDMHKEVPSDRFDAKAHFDPTGKGKNMSHTPFGCFIDNAGLFDPRFFNMSPREATVTDPMQRLALITAFEALEMAGVVPQRTPSSKFDRIGTFYGQTSDDWREINEAQDIDTYFITAGVRAFGPGRINYHFKFSGPSFSVDTACSSSMAALQLACTSLWAGDCDTAIAGGLNVMTNPDIFSGLSKGQFLSKVGPCQTFDNDADGYCRGDGVGAVILKRLEDAQADNDNILAVILSSATNHSADAVSITHPHAETQEILYKKVLDQAGVDALDVSVVEMHGTGTQAGDGTEMRSVTNVFAPSNRQRRPDQKLYLGSVKANVGHGEAASGITALIKALLIFRHNAIPPHVGIKKEMNKGFPKDLTARNVHIALRETPLEPINRKRHIFVNNFSAAGGNTAVLLEEGPVRELVGSDPRPKHVVSVSARALSSLKGNLKNLATYLQEKPDLCLSSLAYTTTARRMHHNYRISFVSKDVAELRQSLLKAAELDIQPESQVPRIAFTFTGQGSHYAALGKDLFDTCAQFRADLMSFNTIATNFGYPSFLPLINGTVDDISTLSPLLVQVGLTSIQMALHRLWAAWGIKPHVVMGHSLGEYAALNAAGVLSVTDTIFLVGERARLLESQCTPGTHAMLAVKLGVSAMSDILKDGKVEVACINSPSETVLSGTSADIESARTTLEARGVKGTKLNVPYAFHSSQVDSILPQFTRIASSVTFNNSDISVLSPLLSSVLTGSSVNAEYLGRHAREAVNFVGALSAGIEAKVLSEQTVFVEIGPHPVCLGFVKATLGSAVATGPSLRRSESPWISLASTSSLLYNKGAAVDWNEYHRDFSQSQKLLELPAYSFALKNYWIDYKNNWCLTKGDVQAPALPAIVAPVLSTTCVQTVVSEEYSDHKGTLVAESDISRPDLYAAISGHLVNGSALCPSSIYGDVGVTIGEYMYRKMHNLPAGAPVPGMNVGKMEVPKPLIAKPGTSQILTMTAHADKKAGSIKLVFSSGKTEHAHCVVEFGEVSDWLTEWKRIAYMVSGRINLLHSQAEAGESHVILRGMAYKLFAALVEYEDTYRGMQKVTMDGKNNEATARVVCQPTKEGQTFVIPPYWIDSVGHLGGFVVNANDELDSKTSVYISHGWDSMRFAQPIEAGKEYQTYVRMIPSEGKVVVGDVYLFDDGEIVGCVGGLKFQCIPRNVFNIFLPPPGAVTQHRAPAPSQEVSVSQTTVKKTASAVKTVERKITVTKSATITSQVLEIIADECGVDLSELADGNSFADLGVDSLMQLSISGRMRENLDLEVPSTLFTDHSSVGSLKSYLAAFEPISDDSGSTTPTLSDSDSDAKSTGSSAKTPDSLHQNEEVFPYAKAYHAIEASMTKEKTVSVETVEVVADSADKYDALIEVSDYAIPLIAPAVIPQRKATSVILQGSPKTATRIFHLIPDGSGSATSYVGIPNISPDTCVFGLNSPYMKTPEEYQCGVPGMAEHFIKEIKRRQPEGPYYVGGWSAGGVIAFETCQQLIRAGDKVAKLVLIDAPCPLIIEPLPISLHRWFNSIGLLGDGEQPKIPSWLLPHFQASINALSTYSARLIDTAKAPKTYAIWCEDGVCKYDTDPRPDPYPYGHAQWLLENRTDFGPNLWDAMVGAQNVKTASVEGNHFSMMRSPYVEKLGDEIRKAILDEE